MPELGKIRVVQAVFCPAKEELIYIDECDECMYFGGIVNNKLKCCASDKEEK